MGRIPHERSEIIRLNIKRYRRTLQTELDEAAHQAMQRMLDEFAAKLCSISRLSSPAGELIYIEVEASTGTDNSHCWGS